MMNKKLLSITGLMVFLLLSANFIQITPARVLEPLSTNAVNEPTISISSPSSSGQFIATTSASQVTKEKTVALLEAIKLYSTNIGNAQIGGLAQSTLSVMNNEQIDCDNLSILVHYLNLLRRYLKDVDNLFALGYAIIFAAFNYLPEHIPAFLILFIAALADYLNIPGENIVAFLAALLYEAVWLYYFVYCVLHLIPPPSAGTITVSAAQTGGLQIQFQNGSKVIAVYKLA